MLNLTTPFVINVTTALLILALGFFSSRQSRRDRTGRLFTLNTVFIAFWIATSAVSDASRDASRAIFFADLALFSPFFSIALIYVFVRNFPYKLKELARWQKIAIFLPTIAITPFLFTSYNIESVSIEPWGTSYVPGPLYGVLAVYMLLMLGLMARELYAKYRHAANQEAKAQIWFLSLGFFSMIGLGAFANLILPFLGYTQASLYGPSATLFFVVFTSYAIAKHHLFDLKVVTAEVFGALLTLVTFLQVIMAESVGEFALRVFLFATTASVAVLLIKSVLQEVRRREEVQRLATELAVSNKRLRQLDDLKTTMVSIASHQIRGPLGGIRGYLTMFRDGDLGPIGDKQKEIVTLNLNVTTRLLNAVETFLDITKLESGSLTLRKEVLPLDEAVKDVYDEFLLPAAKKGLALALAFGCERPIWVEFDPEKIKHVIFNLIDNALKYTEKGSISVRVRCEKGEAVFEVVDTGMGITPEDAPRLFGKYQRGELVIDRGGSGLGLYVVKMLTEMQGGRVWASSPGVGKGSTFGFALRLAPRP